MNNKVLLSQEEIDVLVKFLYETKIQIGEEVLEQTSVDKLLQIVRSGGGQLSLDKEVPSLKKGSGTAVFVLEDGANADGQQDNCELICEQDAGTGYLSIICKNKQTGNAYPITPVCLERLSYDRGDHSVWGYAVPPVTFDNISVLLQVKYSKETFDFICSVFAKTLYGNEQQTISSVYMPNSQNLIRHLL